MIQIPQFGHQRPQLSILNGKIFVRQQHRHPHQLHDAIKQARRQAAE